MLLFLFRTRKIYFFFECLEWHLKSNRLSMSKYIKMWWYHWKKFTAIRNVHASSVIDETSRSADTGYVFQHYDTFERNVRKRTCKFSNYSRRKFQILRNTSVHFTTENLVWNDLKFKWSHVVLATVSVTKTVWMCVFFVLFFFCVL